MSVVVMAEKEHVKSNVSFERCQLTHGARNAGSCPQDYFRSWRPLLMTVTYLLSYPSSIKRVSKHISRVTTLIATAAHIFPPRASYTRAVAVALSDDPQAKKVGENVAIPDGNIAAPARTVSSQH